MKTNYKRPLPNWKCQWLNNTGCNYSYRIKNKHCDLEIWLSCPISGIPLVFLFMESSSLEHFNWYTWQAANWSLICHALIPFPTETARQCPRGLSPDSVLLYLWIAWSLRSTVLHKCYHFLCHDTKRLKCCFSLPSSPLNEQSVGPIVLSTLF